MLKVYVELTYVCVLMKIALLKMIVFMTAIESNIRGILNEEKLKVNCFLILLEFIKKVLNKLHQKLVQLFLIYIPHT